MNPRMFKKKMKELDKLFVDDPEAKHARMDELMCQVLRELGYWDGVEIFENAEMY